MPCALIFNACASFLYNDSEFAGLIHIILILALSNIPFVVLNILDNENSALIVHYVFTAIFPPYIPLGALHYSHKVYLECEVDPFCEEPKTQDYLIPEILVPVVFLFLHSLLLYPLIPIMDAFYYDRNFKAFCSSEVRKVRVFI